MKKFIVNQDIPYDGSKFRVELNIVIYNNIAPKNVYPDFLKDYAKSESTKFWLLCPDGIDMKETDAKIMADELEEKYRELVLDCESSKDWSKMDFLKDWDCLYHK